MLGIISRIYPRPILALLEAIQNAVDSKAKEIRVVVNLKERTYTVEDNGMGMSREQFEIKIKKIGRSEKSQAPDENYGRYGLGLISFYGKFVEYTLTSTSKDMKSKVGWEGYTTHDIAQMTEKDGKLVVPWRPRPDLVKNIPSWNTQVTVSNPAMRNARLIVSLGDLAEEVASRYGERIQANGAKVTIVLIPQTGRPQTRIIDSAPTFKGKALKLIRETLPDCGLISGQLFFREDKGGSVYLKPGGGLNRLPFNTALKAQFTEMGFRKEALADISSGWFDGEISCAGLEMDPDRQHLTENDALLEFAVWLDAYHKDCLDQFTRELQEDAESRLDKSLLSQIAQELKGITHEFFTDMISSITMGGAVPQRNRPIPEKAETVDGNVTPTERRMVSRPEIRDQRPVPPKKEAGEGGGFSIDVVDDASQAREFSRNHPSIRLCLDVLRGSGAHFKWEPEYSLLILNKRHPDYTARKGEPDRKREYLQTIISIALPLRYVSEDAEGYSLMREALVKLGLLQLAARQAPRPPFGRKK